MRRQRCRSRHALWGERSGTGSGVSISKKWCGSGGALCGVSARAARAGSACAGSGAGAGARCLRRALGSGSRERVRRKLCASGRALFGASARAAGAKRACAGSGELACCVGRAIGEREQDARAGSGVGVGALFGAGARAAGAGSVCAGSGARAGARCWERAVRKWEWRERSPKVVRKRARAI